MKIFSIALVVLVASISLLAACGAQPEGVEKTVIVGPELVECEGAGPQMCMLVKENPEDDWQLFYDQIEGFEYEPGYEYVLRVREETVENPPADASSLRWVLLEMMRKTPVELPSSAGELGGVQWQMVTYRNADGELVSSLPVVKSTAEFMDGQVSGSGGCNSYNGTYEVDGNNIQFGPMASTMMACEPPVMNQEQGYFAAMGMATTFQVEGESLQMWDENDEVVVEYEVLEPATLENTPWLLTSYNNGKEAMVSVIIGTEITAVFGEDGTLSGSAGCNEYNASYTATDETISIGLPATTLMFCGEPEGVMDQEAQYLAALENAAVFTIRDDRLEIRDENGSGVAYYTVDIRAELDDEARAEIAMAILANMEYPSEFTASGTAPLLDGEYREKVSEDSATETVVKLTDRITIGILPDGSSAAVVVLATDTGGSGTFYDMMLVADQGAGVQVLGSAPLGDRVRVTTLELENDVISVELITQGPEDPMCCPMQWERRTYEIQEGDLLMTSSEVLGTVSAAELMGVTWKWLGTVSPNDTEIIVEDPSQYTVEFKPDGTVVAKADCNQVGGTYVAADGQIEIETLTTTLAACPPGSLEQQFIQELNAVAIYFFQEGNLFFDLIYDSGTMKFEGP